MNDVYNLSSLVPRLTKEGEIEHYQVSRQMPAFANNWDRPVGVEVKDTPTGAEGLGFESRTGQIGRGVANSSPPLRRFCNAQALSRGDGRRHSLHASSYCRECNKDLILIFLHNW